MPSPTRPPADVPPPDPAARWRQVRALFDAAIDRAPAERDAYLAWACGDDAALAAEVRALVAADEAPATLIARPPLPATRPRAGAAAPASAADGGAWPSLGNGAPSREERAALLVDTRVGRWRLETVLGHGGTSTVFLGRDDTGEAVALKRLDVAVQHPEAAARYRRELRLGGRLRHPRLLHVREAMHDADGSWLVLSYVEGETLRRRLRRAPPLSVSEALRLAVALADALAALHAAGIVHRDVKPENVLLAHAPVADVAAPPDGAATPERPQPLLSDFGIARALDAAGDEEITRAGLLVGTPAYMSPEALVGQRLDAGADVWAFGVVLHELLAGTPPRPGDALRALLRGAAVEGAPLRRARPDVPPALEALVSGLLLPEPRERLADAARAGAALRAIARGEADDDGGA